MFFLNGCVEEKNTLNEIKETSNNMVENKNNDIVVKSPITVSMNQYTEGTTLYIKLVEGEYSEDWSNTSSMRDFGRNYSGTFNIVLEDTNGEVLSSYEINDLNFTELFDLKLDDYNNDGKLDFTLGQFFSSNGYLYRIYSVIDNNIVSLPIEGTEIYISEVDGRFSTTLNKLDLTSFSVSPYSQTQGKYTTNVYKWDGEQFKKI
ncbi:hypothetical protein [Longirhabdus pacifica]|uniref:hypothetical protein n=1 Tax=Longirhabdus pacifica TaxID=2305227 RepID=UPI00100872FB|nr:hypothetical protein [Longirhabdus pacifica]